MSTNTQTPDALAASYALNRHVPDMVRGFTITTNYGDLPITAAEVRQHPDLIQSVEYILQARLIAAGGAA